MKDPGAATGRTVAEFTGMQMAMELTDLPDKAIYIKLTPGTDLFNKVVLCSRHFEVKPAKAGRLLMRAGWLGYIKSKVADMKRSK